MIKNPIPMASIPKEIRKKMEKNRRTKIQREKEKKN